MSNQNLTSKTVVDDLKGRFPDKKGGGNTAKES